MLMRQIIIFHSLKELICFKNDNLILTVTEAEILKMFPRKV